MSFLFRYLRFHDIIGGIHVPVDDGVDKLNRKYTLLVFLFLALPIFTKQYIGDPIECFAPVYFAEHQSRYINSYCWTQSTYYMVPVGDPEDDGDQQEPPDRIMPDEVDYFIGFETVTHIGNERLRRVRVSYYQWAPLILLVQGLCFYIPFLIWNSCANNAGVKLRRLLKKASDIASLPPGCQQREALLAEFVDQFHTLVTGEAGWCADLQCGAPNGSGNSSSGSSSASGSTSSQQQQQQQQQPGQHHPQQQQPRGARGGGLASGPGAPGGGGQANGQAGAQEEPEGRGHRGGAHAHHSQQQPNGCCLISIPIIGSLLACCLKPCSSFGLVGPSKYLCLLYLAVKSAYVFNVGLQFFLLGQFLGRGYLRHGLELINRLIVNGDWWASPRFPLSTLCQVRADMSGGLRSYTCQCVLPINVFNEKIFSVVWFYMAFLMPLNVLSLLFWIYRTFETNRLSYIRLCLWRTRLVELNQIHRTVRRLSQSYLGWDGVFLLRLIEHNHGSIMATLIMSRLWEFYANQMKLQEDANQLALANNAQHTLSNTTTAISNQHQLLAAAAAAAAAASNGGVGSQLGPAGSQLGGGHHHPPPQLAPPPQQQHHHPHANHSHGPQLMSGGPQQHAHFPPHAHGPHGAHTHAHGQPHPNFGGGPQMPMVPHGPHAHHSGQISGQPGHHPLHAANTHHAHHAPPHLGGGPFAGANATLLAQLQHKHHHPALPAGNQQQQGAGSGAPTSNQQASANQPHPTSGGSSSQPTVSGNVAAAVAALAAAAANTTSQQASQQPPTSGGGVAQAAPSASTMAAAASGSGGAQTMHQQQQATSAAGGSAASQTLHLLMQSAAAPTSGSQQTQAGGGTSNNNSSSTGSGSQAPSALQQQQSSASGATSGGPSAATTSFITSAGPPLPPPPPAHVVAAVAAAASGSAGALPPAAAPGMARTSAPQLQQQQVAQLARANGIGNGTGNGAQQQPASSHQRYHSLLHQN